MKAKLFFIAVFMCCLSGIAQTKKVGQNFKFKANAMATFVSKMKGTSLNKIFASGATITIDEDIICVVQNVTATDVFFYVKDFSPLNPNKKKEKPLVGTINDKSYYYNDLLFSIPIDTYETSAEDYTRPDKISFGVLTLPYKLRPQKNASYDAEFNLNSTFSYLIYPFKNIKVYAQLGGGLGSVGLSNSNAPGLNADQAQNVSCFTGFGGVMVQYKDVQAGLYLGGDWIKNNAKYNWESQGNLWVSFGVGFKVFTISKKEAAN